MSQSFFELQPPTPQPAPASSAATAICGSELQGFGAPKGLAANAAAVKLQQAQLQMSAAEHKIELIEYYPCNTKKELERREGEISATEHHTGGQVYTMQQHHTIKTMNTVKGSGYVEQAVHACKVCYSKIPGAGMGVFTSEQIPNVHPREGSALGMGGSGQGDGCRQRIGNPAAQCW